MNGTCTQSLTFLGAFVPNTVDQLPVQGHVDGTWHQRKDERPAPGPHKRRNNLRWQAPALHTTAAVVVQPVQCGRTAAAQCGSHARRWQQAASRAAANALGPAELLLADQLVAKHVVRALAKIAPELLL
jgi:hypothetical protein